MFATFLICLYHIGVLFKLSHLQRIGINFAYFGKRKLTVSEIESLYGTTRHIPENRLKNDLRSLFDLFSIAEGCLIADSIEQYEFR